MDEKEQADRMAAAEALYMISTRVDKSGPVTKLSKRGRKKKLFESDEVIPVKRKDEDFGVGVPERRGRGRRGGGQRGASASRRGRGGKNNSPRGRGAGRGRKTLFEEDFIDESSDISTNKYDNLSYFHKSQTASQEFEFDDATEQNHKKKTNKTKTAKARDQRKSSQSPQNASKSPSGSGLHSTQDQPAHHAIGFTGATISITEYPTRRASVEPSHNLGSVTGIKQYNLSSRNTAMSLSSLPSINLPSFTTDGIANLPSIPLEIASLHLSSQPTPNLSSLGDITGEGVMEDDEINSDREKSEKFLPLKKRKLLNPTPVTATENLPSTTRDVSPPSDDDDSYEPMSPPPRATFTVQAPPIITMQTLMEIKTALTADDDGDLPLHIAVVHENMRMVIKLINLMRIAGKGVDKFNKQQQTPLHLAVKLDFLPAVDILIKSGASINAVDCTGSSSIHMAVQGRSTKCLQMLLERCQEAELNTRNFDGLTPLHTAVDNGDLEQVELLLKYGAEIDVTDGKSGRTCLFHAAESNEKPMVELLLRHGANPDVPNYAGVTTAMAAQGRNLHGVLKLLGADRFTDADTKPFVTPTRETAVYIGFPTSNQQGEATVTKAITQNKQSGREMTHLIEAKNGTEKGETPNETKVFHNVFVVSQKNPTADVDHDMKSWRNNKSRSEPSSPDVKMEVEDKNEMDRGRVLLSLPEGITHLKEQTAKSGGQKGQSPEYRHKLTSHPDRKPGVPPAHSASGSPSGPSHASSPNVSKPLTDTSTLTSNQARLFQKLLEMYNIESTGPSATVTHSLSSSQSGQKSPHVVRASDFPCQQPEASVGLNLSKYAARDSSSSAYAQHLEHIGHSPLFTGVSSHSIKAEEAPPSPSSPLNLSKAAFNLRPAQSPASPNSEAASRIYDITPSSKILATKSVSVPSFPGQRVISIGVRRISDGEKDGEAPSIPGGQYEIILHPPNSGGQQVLASSLTQRGANISTLPLAKEGSGSAISQQENQGFQQGEGRNSENSDQATHAPYNTKLVSQRTASLVRNFLNKQSQGHQQQQSQASVTSATPAPTTALPVQSVISAPPAPATALPVPSSFHQLGPKVMDSSTSQRKPPLMPNKVTHNIITEQRTHSDLGSKVSASQTNPASSPSPVFLHQGKVIDLSMSSEKEGGQTVKTFLTMPVILAQNKFSAAPNQPPGPDLTKGKIVGFSGAILTVVPSQQERLENVVSEKLVEVKVKDQPAKEPQKKRVRKAGKVAQDLPPAEASLSKIHSETDERLRQFLGAKKSEVSFLSGSDDEHSGGATSRAATNPVYKTVGIFSGDVQHVRIGKMYNSSTPPHAFQSSHTPPLFNTSIATTAASTTVGAPSYTNSARPLPQAGPTSALNSGLKQSMVINPTAEILLTPKNSDLPNNGGSHDAEGVRNITLQQTGYQNSVVKRSEGGLLYQHHQSAPLAGSPNSADRNGGGHSSSQKFSGLATDSSKNQMGTVKKKRGRKPKTAQAGTEAQLQDGGETKKKNVKGESRGRKGNKKVSKPLSRTGGNDNVVNQQSPQPHSVWSVQQGAKGMFDVNELPMELEENGVSEVDRMAVDDEDDNTARLVIEESV